MVSIVWAGSFYWKNLRGVGPAIQKPTEDITELIGEPESTPTVKAPAPAENRTDFPLTLPDGFSISIFAKELGGQPRVIAWDSLGNMVVSLTKSNKVVVLPDDDNDGKADEVITLLSNLDRPHGLAFKCDEGCKLYVAEEDQVAVYDYDQVYLQALGKQKLVDLPSGGRHFTRTLLFRPPPNDNELLVSIGSSCDTCLEEDDRRAAIWSLNVETKKFKPFAKGLRNSVFMTLHPTTSQTWATDMGRDHLGDDLPPDEINIVKEGGNYGWPICYGKNIHDTVFDKNTYIRNPCLEPFETPSHIDIAPAHSSPLGLTFFDDSWPVEFQNNLLVAMHGSWNRTEPSGYKIVRYLLDDEGNYIGEEDFVSGWLRPDKTALGRPAGILMGSGNSIYISDDKAGVIYKVAMLSNE